MENKNINGEEQGISANPAVFFKKMDTAISEIEQSLSEMSKKGRLSEKVACSEGYIEDEEIMERNICKDLGGNLGNAISVKQYDSAAEQSAFLEYIARGDARLNQKMHLLSRNCDDNGYRVPCQTMGQLEKRMRYLCPMRTIAKIDKISGHLLDIFVDKNDAEAGWMVSNVIDDGEEQEVTHLQILAHQMYARPRTTQKILDDVKGNLQEWIITKIAQKMAALENYAFLHGNGENQPTGILHYPVVPVGNGSWGKIESVEQLSTKPEIRRESLLEVACALGAQYLSGAVWLMSRSALMAVQNIRDDMGRFLWQQSMSAGAPSTLLGYSVIICDDMPGLTDNDNDNNNNNSVPVLFGNFEEAYQIVDRSDISVLRDPYSRKPFVEFFVTKRTGGDVINFDAIKALKMVYTQ
jgi:HK97 family phage major capsid protein